MAPSVSHGISRLENSASPHSPCACHAVQQARPPPLTRRNWRLASTRRPAHGRSQQLSLPLPHLGSSQKPFCMQAMDEPRGSSPTGHQSPELRSDEPGSQEKTWRNLRCTSLMERRHSIGKGCPLWHSKSRPFWRRQDCGHSEKITVGDGGWIDRAQRMF